MPSSGHIYARIDAPLTPEEAQQFAWSLSLHALLSQGRLTKEDVERLERLSPQALSAIQSRDVTVSVLQGCARDEEDPVPPHDVD